jgi:hypothetical protein
MTSTMQALSDAVQKAGSAVYGQAEQAGHAGGPAEGTQQGDEGTVEGEFREV